MSTPTYSRLNPTLAGDVEQFVTVFRASPSFVYLTEGRAPTDSEVIAIMNRVPGYCRPEDVFIRTISLDGMLCGLAVTVRAYPNPQTAFLALLLIVESAQGQLLGTRVLRDIEGEAKSWGCSSISAAVDSRNVRALKFWLREGFVERFRKGVSGFMGQAIAIEKEVLRPIG